VRYLDLFRGSSDERIARQYIKALREVGEIRRLEFDAQSRLVIAYDENGHRSQVRFIGNLAREIRSGAEDTHDAIYWRYAASSVTDVTDSGEAPKRAVIPKRRAVRRDGCEDFVSALTCALALSLRAGIDNICLAVRIDGASRFRGGGRLGQFWDSWPMIERDIK
jgi:hypothetical protein